MTVVELAEVALNTVTTARMTTARLPTAYEQKILANATHTNVLIGVNGQLGQTVQSPAKKEKELGKERV